MTSRKTHEDQGRIQILLVLLEKELIVPFGFLAVVLVELSLVGIHSSEQRILVAAIRSLVTFWPGREKERTHVPVVHHSVPYLYSPPVFLQVTIYLRGQGYGNTDEL